MKRETALRIMRDKKALTLMQRTQEKGRVAKNFIRIICGPVFVYAFYKAIFEDFRFNRDLKKNHSDNIFEFSYQDKKVKFYLPYLKKRKGLSEVNEYGIFSNKNFAEVDLLEKYSKYFIDAKKIVDAGANIGNHTLYFGLVCKDIERIYSFEPIEGTYSILKKNIEINGLEDKVCAYCTAVGATNGKAGIIDYNPGHLGGTTLKNDDNGTIEMVTIDDKIAENDKIDFVKMDIERFEYEALKGMLELMKRDKPTIWVEIYRPNINKVSLLLKSQGYTMVENDGDDYVFRVCKDENFLK